MLSTICRLLHTLLVHAKSNDHHWLEEPKYFLADEMNPSKLLHGIVDNQKAVNPARFVIHKGGGWVSLTSLQLQK
jgi:hypothetical protein